MVTTEGSTAIRSKIAPIVIIDCLLLAVGLFGILRLHSHGSPLFEYEDSEGRLIVGPSQLFDPSFSGAIIDSVDGSVVPSRAELLFLLERKSAGDSLDVRAHHGAQVLLRRVELKPTYSVAYLITTGLVGLFVWFVGVFVHVRQSQRTSARYFHWAMMVFWIVIALGTEQHFPGAPTWSVFMLRFLYIGTYALLPALFIKFTLTFPESRVLRARWENSFIYFLPVASILILTQLQYRVCFYGSLAAQRLYVTWFAAFYVYIVLALTGGIAIIVWKYSHLASHDERKQMRWLVWGISVAAAPFLLLRALPQALGFLPFASEELVNIFFIFVPLSFGIAIVREHLLDIDVVIKRTFVYGVVSVLVILGYMAAISFFTGVVGKILPHTEAIGSAIVAITVALFLKPVIDTLQRMFDKFFYRLKYDFNVALEHTTTTLSQALTLERLAETLLQLLQHYLQVKGVIIVLHRQDKDHEYWRRGDVPDSADRGVSLTSKGAITRNPVALTNTVEATRLIESIPEIEPHHSIVLLVPLRFGEKGTGVIGLSRKLSGQLFFVEEIEFVKAVADICSVIVQRLDLQESLIIERAEKDQLAKENRELELLQKMRQDLSSMIVHDLRNPLTGIIVGAQIVYKDLSGRMKEIEQRTMNTVISNGKAMLEMINDLLEIHKMEEGELKLVLEKVRMEEIVLDAVRQVELTAAQKEIRIDTDLEPACPSVDADKEKITRVVVNLLSNAIKFSEKKSTVCAKVRGLNSHGILVAVQDHGPGIPPEYIDRVFDKFVQVESQQTRRRYSTGLGLTYCELAIARHGGKIWVESQLGAGSTFYFELPASAECKS